MAIKSSGCLKLHLHLYDKEERADRKLGHINITANSQAELDASIKQLKGFLP
jgi:5-(carboxyamino)imidazole ribonucleotide synthase